MKTQILLKIMGYPEMVLVGCATGCCTGAKVGRTEVGRAESIL